MSFLPISKHLSRVKSAQKNKKPGLKPNFQLAKVIKLKLFWVNF